MSHTPETAQQKRPKAPSRAVQHEMPDKFPYLNRKKLTTAQISYESQILHTEF